METSASCLLLPSLPSSSSLSASSSSLSSSNSLFFTNGRKELLFKNTINANAVVLTRSIRRGAQRGMGCRCLFGLGVPELVVIAGVAALVFGPKKLPEVGRTIGKTVRSFQQAAKEFETELKKEGTADVSAEKPTAVREGKKESEEGEIEASGTKENL